MAKKKSGNTPQTKKQIKKELAGKIESAVPEIKVRLGEKKFNKRIKKATRLLTEGLDLNHNHKQKLNHTDRQKTDNKNEIRTKKANPVKD